jgi:uncharacterized protein (TIGR03083 family)
MTSSPLADRVIAALRSGHDDLAGYAAGLDEKGLAGPSGAAEWPVAQVLSHLGSGAEIGLATLERALAGGGQPPEGANESVWDRWNAMSPAEQRDGFLVSNDRLVSRYESLDAATREDLRIDLGFLPAPVSVAEAARMRLSEFALHEWDVRAVAQPGATVAYSAVPLLLDGYGSMLAWIARPHELGGRRAALAVQLREPQASYGLVLGEQVSLGEAPAEPDGVLRLPAEAWLRLLTGRLGPQFTPPGVQVQGPVTLDDLRRVFPGF